MASKCPQPSGFFIDKKTGEKVPAACNSWNCPVCGPKKKKRFLYELNEATRAMQERRFRFRHMVLTLDPKRSVNELISKYWNRIRNSLRKAGYNLKYFVKVVEFQPQTGMVHLHVLVTIFIPWNIVLYYWKLATSDHKRLVWSHPGKATWRDVPGDGHIRMTNATVRHSAAYISKYMAEDLDSQSKFKKRQRRFSKSRAMREFWPKRRESGSNPDRWAYKFDPEGAASYDPVFEARIRAIRAEIDRDSQRYRLLGSLRSLRDFERDYWVRWMVGEVD